ncbi:hypothetical protein PsorP6_001075 [Peronosclerospora sorghi]|uniref:Uncharacterized protein n=1 Tax=Peronosclerospora sorghi TaxID=230839 RepID=A0ACC0X019_9STRA|nr:hypothetical protein PsorP6_001075 [Peronosclerospora sorghi]
MLYGYVTSNLFPLLATYAIGDALSIVFLAVYVHWATERKVVLKTCAVALLCNAAVTVYVILVKSGFLDESQESLTLIVGVIAIVSSLVLYASPLAAIKIVLQTRSSASLPIVMILAGTLNNILWTVYGFLVHDMFVIVPTSVNAALGLVQVALYGLYHPSRFAASDAAALTPTNESFPCKYYVMGSPTPLPISRVKESIEICSISIKDPCNNAVVELDTPRTVASFQSYASSNYRISQYCE